MKSSNSWTSYKLNIIELEPKDLTFIDNDKISVSSIKLSHGIPCTGFVFKLKNNSNISYAYCSDTAYEPSISEKLKI